MENKKTYSDVEKLQYWMRQKAFAEQRIGQLLKKLSKEMEQKPSHEQLIEEAKKVGA